MSGFRASAFALAVTAMGGCEGGIGLAPRDAKPLSQARMAGGAVTLVAPSGFCIDSGSLEARFALMARCDALGANAAAAGAPLGLITVSLVPSAPGTALPTPQDSARAADLSGIGNVTQDGTTTLFRARGAAPNAALAPVHWRGIARLGSFAMGAALYGEPEGRAVSEEGAEILAEMIRRSIRATPDPDPATLAFAPAPQRANSFE
jgi:hypothetical protein